METKLILHKDINTQTLNKICALKSVHWHFPLEKQLEWIQHNIQDLDHHLLIDDNNELVAYMNLVSIEVDVNDIRQEFKGIGNVCTRTSGSGLGNVLMAEANRILTQHNWRGILLCKDNLVPFYAKYNWVLVDKSKIKNDRYSDIHVMVFNTELVDSLSYDGRNF